MGITLEEAKALQYGDILYHTELENSNGSPKRFRVSGQVKTLKRTPDFIKVPLKHGLYDHAYLINNECTKYVDGNWLIPMQEVELNEEKALEIKVFNRLDDERDEDIENGIDGL